MKCRSMVMKCAACGIVNVPTAKVCECGYSFVTFTTAAIPPRASADKESSLVSTAVSAVIRVVWIGPLLGATYSASSTSSRIGTAAKSAPQQAALAGYALAWTVLPYTALPDRLPRLWASPKPENFMEACKHCGAVRDASTKYCLRCGARTAFTPTTAGCSTSVTDPNRVCPTRRRVRRIGCYRHIGNSARIFNHKPYRFQPCGKDHNIGAYRGNR